MRSGGNRLSLIGFFVCEVMLRKGLIASQTESPIFMQYNQYLQTAHWKSKRLEKLEDKSVCQICKSTSNINIHHKRYTYDGKSILFNERKEDLVTLCSSCHRLLHKYFGIEVHKLNKKICRIRRLIELGTVKNKAFYFASQDELFYSIKTELVKMN